MKRSEFPSNSEVTVQLCKADEKLYVHTIFNVILEIQFKNCKKKHQIIQIPTLNKRINVSHSQCIELN